MTKAYDSAERLREQVEILVSEASPTSAVVLSTFGSAAVPLLTRILEAGPDAKERLRGQSEDVIVLALGLIASPDAVPALERRLASLKGHHSRGGDAVRATVNGLRKIGTPEALKALAANLECMDPAHAATTFGAFGDEGRGVVVRQLEVARGAAFETALEVARRWQSPEAVGPLLRRLDDEHEVALAAAYGLCGLPGVPRAPLVERFAKVAPHCVGVREASASWSTDGRHRHVLFEALLAAIYHTQGVEAIPDLLPWAAVELEREQREEAWRRNLHDSPVRRAIISLGEVALPRLEGAAVADAAPSVLAVATDLASRIRHGEKVRAPRTTVHAGI